MLKNMTDIFSEQLKSNTIFNMTSHINFTMTTPNNGGYSNLSNFGVNAGSGDNLLALKRLKQLQIMKKLAEQRAYLGPIAVKYHLVLGTLILLANGFLIGFYIKYPKIRRYISVTMLSVFLVSFLQGLSETIFRPIFFSTFYVSKVISLSKEGATGMCLTSNILHEFTVYLVALLLPLLSVERFVRVKFPHQKEMVTRNMFRVTIALIVLLALIIAFLPMTDVYAAKPVWPECDGRFVRNNQTAYVLGTVAFITVFVPLIMYIQMVMIGKKTLNRGSLSERRAKIIRKASVTAAIITVIYILSSVPYAIVFALVLGCRTHVLDTLFCADVTKKLVFLYLLAVQKVGYAVAPIFFTFLHPKLRQKIVQCWKECPTTDSQWSTTGSYSASKQSKQKTSKQATDSGLASSSSGYNSQHSVELNEHCKTKISSQSSKKCVLEDSPEVQNEVENNSVSTQVIKRSSLRLAASFLPDREVQLSVLPLAKPETKEMAVQTSPSMQKAPLWLQDGEALLSRSSPTASRSSENCSENPVTAPNHVTVPNSLTVPNSATSSNPATEPTHLSIGSDSDVLSKIECTDVWDGTKNVWHSL